MNGLTAAQAAWVAGPFVRTKYVTGITIAAATGIITVTYDGTVNGISQLGGANTIAFTPRTSTNCRWRTPSPAISIGAAHQLENTTATQKRPYGSRCGYSVGQIRPDAVQVIS